MVVGTKGDPATPYESTAKLADMLGVGTVLTWEGEGHTAYPETTCIRRAVDNYLIDLKVPAKGTDLPGQLNLALLHPTQHPWLCSLIRISRRFFPPESAVRLHFPAERVLACPRCCVEGSRARTGLRRATGAS